MIQRDLSQPLRRAAWIACLDCHQNVQSSRPWWESLLSHQDSAVPKGSFKKLIRADGGHAPLASADSHAFLQRQDEDLAVTDAAIRLGKRRTLDGLHRDVRIGI